MLIFGATINVVPWVYVSNPDAAGCHLLTAHQGPEILPLEARSRGTAISVSAHWMWNFCKLYPKCCTWKTLADLDTSSHCYDE